MKQILFTALLCTFITFTQAKDIIISNCPDFDQDLVCMNTRWDASIGEFALIDIHVDIPSSIQNNNWRVQFATTTSVFIEHWNFRSSSKSGYTHEYSYSLPINSNQSGYVFAVYLIDDESGFRAYGKQMTFYVCGSGSSQRLSTAIGENSNFESSSLLNEESDTNFSIFPNPFREKFSIQYEAIQNEDINLEIFDISGTLRYSTKFQHENSGIYRKKLESLNLERGSYLCKVISNKSHKTIKLLKTL